MNNKANTDLHSPLLLSRQNENKNQYALITESFRGKIGNWEESTRLIFPRTVPAVNDSCGLIIGVT